MLSISPKSWSDQQRVYATLAYFDVFDLALNAEEIAQRILGLKIETDRVLNVLADLKDQVETDGQYFCLAGRMELFGLVEKKKSLAKKYLNFAEEKKSLFIGVPFIRSVFLCNNLIYSGVTENSDIDLFIIAKSDRLMIARTWLTVWMHINKVRRHGKKIAGRFCLSFYVSDKAVAMKDLMINQEDIYFAYWMMGLTPLIGNSAEELMDKNNWLEDFFIDYKKRYLVDVVESEKLKESFWAKVLSGKLGQTLENFLFNIYQKRYLKNQAKFSDRASVMVNRDILKYHNIDRRAEFKAKFLERLERFSFSG